jgi:hypothetical protein
MTGTSAWRSCDRAAAGFGAKIRPYYAAGNIAQSAHSELFSAY